MEEKKAEHHVSRRSFIKGAALGGGALAIAGMGSAKNAYAAAPPKKWDKETEVIVVGGGGAGKPILPGLDGLHEALAASQITDLYPVPHQRTDALPAEFSSGPALQQPLRCADVVEAAEVLFNAASAQKLTT